MRHLVSLPPAITKVFGHFDQVGGEKRMFMLSKYAHDGAILVIETKMWYYVRNSSSEDCFWIRM